jgi:large subunit ribosomal protein L19
MNQNLLTKIENASTKVHTDFEVGDTIAVSLIVREGEKKRTQIFRGLVISMRGDGIRKTFTVRKISYGIGVEKIFPIFSPNIESIRLVKKGDVRRANISYMRKRVGKRALKVKEGELVIPEEGTDEEAPKAAGADQTDVKAEATTKVQPEAEAKAENSKQ